MSDQDAKSRVLTLVFTDLADSTALKTQRGDAAIASLISRHTAHIKRLATDCGGRIIDWAGDGCFLTFETSSSAVLFALRLQQAHAEEADLPGVRIGIHMGEVTVSANEDGAPRVAGLAVDLAARISGLARPGQVLMSAAVYDSARQRIGVESLGQPILWQAHGTYSLKGFDKELDIGEAGMKDIAPLTAPASGDKAKLIRRAKQPAPYTNPASAAWKRSRRFLPLAIAAIVVVALLGAAYLAGQSRNGNASPAPPPVAADANSPIKSLAVLPLENLSADPEQEYFADGMTEAITSELSKIKALKVVSRTSVTRFKKTQLPIDEVAEQLGVEGLIEGSVQREGNDVKVTVQLIHGPSDSHRWTKAYTGEVKSVLKLQSDIALAIADEIKAELTGDERARIAGSHEVEPAAYDLYTRGMHYREVGSIDQTDKSLKLFEEAVKIDPQFSEAWAEVGYLYSRGPRSGQTLDKIRAKSREASLKALELDGDVPMAHIALGFVAMLVDWEWEQAERSFRRAIELDPNFVRGRLSYGYFLNTVGRMPEALEQAALVDHPELQDPWTLVNLTATRIIAGDPATARDLLRGLVANRPEFAPALRTLSSAYIALGDYQNAIATAEKLAGSTGDELPSLSPLALAYAVAGQAEAARSTLEKISNQSDANPLEAVYIVMVHALLGDIDAAFRRIEAPFQARDVGLTRIRTLPFSPPYSTNPNVIAFRSDPRYWELMGRMKFPPLPPDHPGYAEEQAWLAKKKAAADANAPIRKIAVLPFKNISDAPDQEWFVDGMTEALISELAKIKSIKVISRTSAMHYKNTTQTLPEIARELGVDGLVEGSAMKADNQVRITAQLIRAATDEHLWAESYTETLENVLKVQAQVALAITTEIKAVVTPDERSRVSAAKTVNIAAYELYVQGRHHWSQRTPEGFQRALDLFTKLLQIDPDFALGHVGLADTYLMLSDYYLTPSAEALRQSREEAEKALALDPALGEAYVTLAFIGMSQNWDWNGSKAAFLKSIELSPNHATAHHWYGVYLSAAGRHSQSVEEMWQAYQLDPASPVIAADYAGRLARNGQIQPSVDLAKRLEIQYPHNGRVQMGLARTYGTVGRYGDALAAAERMVAADGSKAYAAMYKAVALAHLARADEARRLIEDTTSGTDVAIISSFQVARAYAALNDPDRAIEWLTKAVETHDPYAWRLRLFPEFDALENDPRYQALLRRMNFPEAQAQN